MAVTTTTLTLTPTWASKRLTIEGDASVRETVTLRLVGCSDDTSIVVKISSDSGRVDYAKFSPTDGDVWTVDGDDLTGSLSLNTDTMVAAFAPYGPDDRLGMVVTIASAANSNLYAKACKQFGNWMEDADDPVAYSTPLRDDVDQLQTDLDALEAAHAAHTHNGTADGGPQLAHSSLSGVGVNTHAAIDAALNDYSSAVATVQANINEQTARVDDHEERLSAIEDAITPGAIDTLPSADDATFLDLHSGLAAVIAFVNSLKGSQA